MSYKVLNSSLALKTLYAEVLYVKTKFGLKAANDFLSKVEELIILLQKDPYVFQKYNENTFKVVIVKQVTMYYAVYENTIEILLFWNTNQNPIKLKNML